MRAHHIFLLMIVLLASAIVFTGCTSTTPRPSEGDADTMPASADTAYEHAHYRSAARLYEEAYREYEAVGDTSAARTAINGRVRAERMTAEFPYNLTAVSTLINTAFPDVPTDRKAAWLTPEESQQIVSDGEVLYYEGTVRNIYYHNPDLLHAKTADAGHTGLYDDVKDVAFAPAVPGEGPYRNPVRWEGIGTLSIPRNLLPENGTLRLWVPLPIDTESQRNVTVLSVEPAGYVVNPPDTNGDIGIVYLEIPLEGPRSEYLNVTTRFRFTTYEQRFDIDPEKVGVYNTSDPLYIRYTGSGDNIVVTPDMKAKALEIVGNETSPFLQAEKIYWHIIDTYPYSVVPHLMLNTAEVPESSYVLSTGFGDCGTQSMYFAALCRSLGIPARATGGYQLIPGVAGSHFWAEFYLPGYGWVPVDVTVAETADWSFNATDKERLQFMTYYFGNLDPYRYIIQNDVDIPLTPDPGDAVIFSLVRQYPAAVCNTCTEDVELIAATHWKTEVRQV